MKKIDTQKIEVVGIDLAKTYFQVHGMTKTGKPILKKKLRRKQFIEFVANLPKCLVAMEACGGAHFFARKFREFGHEVRLIAPQFVKPFVKTNKNDAADAAAIAEVVTRESTNFVAIKETWQQEIQAIHRVRERLVKARTALSNEIRGLLYEFGVVIPRGFKSLFDKIAELLSIENEEISKKMKGILHDLNSEIIETNDRIQDYEIKLKEMLKEHEECKRIQQVRGVGLITATALVAAVGDPRFFKNGRQFAAWLGLVPRHEGTGGKNRIMGISKRGDRYLRSLLVHGARAALHRMLASKSEEPIIKWVKKLYEKKGANKACVALANKNARIIWAMLAHKKDYNPNHVQECVGEQ